MFKSFFLTAPQKLRVLVLAAGISLALCGCVSGPPLPAADLSAPDWTVRQGQAVWRSKRTAPEIAGEILLATNRTQTFVQFTKTPFPFVIARTDANQWQIEAPAQNRRFTGRGHPPARLIWFQLPHAVAGAALPTKWSWQNSESGWRLENISTGEALEGYFTQ